MHDVILTEVALAGTAKRGVTLGENVLGLEVGNELVLRALDRKLDLVCLPNVRGLHDRIKKRKQGNIPATGLILASLRSFSVR